MKCDPEYPGAQRDVSHIHHFKKEDREEQEREDGGVKDEGKLVMDAPDLFWYNTLSLHLTQHVLIAKKKLLAPNSCFLKKAIRVAQDYTSALGNSCFQVWRTVRREDGVIKWKESR